MKKHSSRSRTQISNTQFMEDILSNPTANLPSLNQNTQSLQNSKNNSKRNSILFQRIPQKSNYDVYNLLQQKNNKYDIGKDADYDSEKILANAEKKLNSLQFSEILNKKNVKNLPQDSIFHQKKVNMSDSSDESIEVFEKNKKKKKPSFLSNISAINLQQQENYKEAQNSNNNDNNTEQNPNQSKKRKQRKSIFETMSSSLIVSPNFAQSYNILENNNNSQQQYQKPSTLQQLQALNIKNKKQNYQEDYINSNNNNIIDRLDKRSEQFLKRNQSLTNILQKQEKNKFSSEKKIYLPSMQSEIKEEPEEEFYQNQRQYKIHSKHEDTISKNSGDESVKSLKKGCLKNNEQIKKQNRKKSVYFGNKSVLIDSNQNQEKIIKTKLEY